MTIAEDIEKAVEQLARASWRGFAPGSRLSTRSSSTPQLSGTPTPASLIRMGKKLLPRTAPGARANCETDAARSGLNENTGFQFTVVNGCDTLPAMKTKKLTEALERVEAWSSDAQNELAELALELDAGFKDGEYEPTPEELAGIDRGLRAAAEGRFASDQQVEAVFAKFRGR
jgi:predicted transcriptional regulator